MALASNIPGSMAIAPLGAGDLIDRAVRFYRQNFLTLILIAAPPVVVGAIFTVGWTILGRQLFTFTSDAYDPERMAYYLFGWLGGFVILLVEAIATFVVMGGASRNFIRHILFDEKLTFAETYRNVWSRLFSLVTAATIIVTLLGVIGFVIVYIGAMFSVLAALLLAAFLAPIPVVSFLVGTIVGIAGTVGALWLFFLIASRFVYVPQVMLVEGQGVASAIGRSASLASGNVRRLMALFLFSTLATYSALALLYIPVAWYAWSIGVEIWTFGQGIVPAWYELANSLIWQISLILLTPVWMIGLCLLYVDERVRSEGYDIELMAAQRLGDIPAVPTDYVNPLQPALANSQANIRPDQINTPSNGSMLGL
ncbi:MAG TPA: hypothetical protein PKA82_03130 [Pyrinomonadaceae bacterium]|nr:hypothetical protein [Pyrinomonadaceae bacterium]